jgi:uncharacterized repeat protein (TIGR02059 family)
MAAPVLQSATVKNTKFMLKFDGDLDGKAVPDASAFALLVDGETVAVSHFKVKGDSIKMFVTGTDKIQGGAVVTLSYTDPTAGDDANALQGVDGMDVAGFLDFSVTNQGKVKPVKGDKVPASKLDTSGETATLVGVHDVDLVF